jgi:hypothetical protein
MLDPADNNKSQTIPNIAIRHSSIRKHTHTHTNCAKGDAAQLQGLYGRSRHERCRLERREVLRRSVSKLYFVAVLVAIFCRYLFLFVCFVIVDSQITHANLKYTQNEIEKSKIGNRRSMLRTDGQARRTSSSRSCTTSRRCCRSTPTVAPTRRVLSNPLFVLAVFLSFIDRD